MNDPRTRAVPIEGPPVFRPAARLLIDSSRRPATDPVPMWLRELRRDTREQVL